VSLPYRCLSIPKGCLRAPSLYINSGAHPHLNQSITFTVQHVITHACSLEQLTHTKQRLQGLTAGKNSQASLQGEKKWTPISSSRNCFCYLSSHVHQNKPGRCSFCTGGARHGRRRGRRRGRGRRFRGRRGPRSPPPHRASPATSRNHSSTSPYTAGLVSHSPSPAA
jgi:hypothetical protein